MPATVMSRFSYPKVPGDGLWSIVDVTGLASYAVIVIGTPPTGGQLVTPADCGLQSIDWIQSMGSDNGQYDVTCYPAPFTLGNPFAGVRLQWLTAATGAEAIAATNLSARSVRLLVIGR
jgi:hypothetical protein